MDKKLDSTKQAIEELKDLLGITESHLAVVLGTTPKSLGDWKKRGMADIPPRAHRLVRLYEVVNYLQKHHPEVNSKNYKGLLENGRIILDPNDEDEGNISLLNFIKEEPNSKVWVPCVDQVVKDYLGLLKATEQHRLEIRRSVSNAN